MNIKAIAAAIALSIGLAQASTASAAVTFAGTSGAKSASVTFDVTGTNLTVLLTNTSLADASVPTDILTGVFWDTHTSLSTLTRVSALMAPGSAAIYTSQPSNGAVGGEWAWKGNLGSSSPGTDGISAAGLGLFGPGDRFPGLNLSGPNSVAGIDWGLTTAGDNPLTGNGGVLGTALVKNGVLFTFSGLPTGFKLSDIYDVTFQYGTSLSEPEVGGTQQVITSVPTPASFTGGLLLLFSLTLRRRPTHN